MNPDAIHGTRSGYQYWNCRCDECRRWSREYIRERRSKRKAAA